jgi:glycosyltransferase involved in cell wall biosynthesis
MGLPILPQGLPCEGWVDVNAEAPTISVIIPTHNRCASLRRTLDALCTQTYPPQLVHVLVAADGCVDGTVEMLRRYRAPFGMRIIEQQGQGPAAARNHGAAHATGRLLLFLDDDIQAVPSLIEAHVSAHQRGPGQVVIGYLPPVLASQAGFFRIQLRLWWEAMFDAMRQPGHRCSYRDLLSGNFSLAAELFARIGGFDPTLRCHEDYELGMRLIKAGASFTFAADALGYHYEMTDLDRSLRRKYQEGQADVLLGSRHPELRRMLPLARFRGPHSPLSRLLYALAFAWPGGGDLLAARLRRLLDPLERARLRSRWRRLLDDLLGYWYWRGVGVELGSRRALAGFIEGGQSPVDEGGDEIEIDLRQGLEAAERQLDEARPSGVHIRYGRQSVGRIPPQPGVEGLRGVHLRPVLATDLAMPLLKALALEGSTEAASAGGHVLVAGPAPSLEAVHADSRP